jgi:hypothetical protein
MNCTTTSPMNPAWVPPPKRTAKQSMMPQSQDTFDHGVAVFGGRFEKAIAAPRPATAPSRIKSPPMPPERGPASLNATVPNAATYSGNAAAWARATNIKATIGEPKINFLSMPDTGNLKNPPNTRLICGASVAPQLSPTLNSTCDESATMNEASQPRSANSSALSARNGSCAGLVGRSAAPKSQPSPSEALAFRRIA